jgi:hypothetical protein
MAGVACAVTPFRFPVTFPFPFVLISTFVCTLPAAAVVAAAATILIAILMVVIVSKHGRQEHERSKSVDYIHQHLQHLLPGGEEQWALPYPQI